MYQRDAWAASLRGLAVLSRYPAIAQESGAVNHLRVIGHGKQATFWVNGEKMLEMKGMPPNGGGKVGLDLGTSNKDTEPSKLTFANFQVRELPTQ
jgi:hypothetical protein